MHKSKPFISSVLALSVAIAGVYTLASQNGAAALTKGDGVAPLKEDAYSYRRLAMKYFTDGEDAHCLEAYQKAIDLASRDSGANSSYVSDLYFEMGCAAKQRAKLATAEHCFQEALKHRPNSIPARLQLASVYTSEGKRGEAFNQIKAAKVKNPHSPQAQGALVAYIQGMNRPAEAAREASLIKAMLPGGSKSGGPGVSHFDNLTDLKQSGADDDKKAKESNQPAKEVAKEPAKEPVKETKTAEAETKNSSSKGGEAKLPAVTASAENRMPATLGSTSVLRGLMHGTANQQQQQQQPAAPAPIVTPVAPPVQAPVAPKVDDKELELAKAKAQLEMMRKKLEAAEQSKATKNNHDQSKHNDSHKNKPKHQPKVEDVATDVGERAASLHTKAVLEKPKKGSASNRVQSNAASEKSSGESSHSDGGGENVVLQSSDLRHLEPPAGVIAPQYVPIGPAPKKVKGHGTSMVPPPPPTPVFGGGMPMMQQPAMPAPQKPKPVKPKPVKPKPAEEDSSSSSSSPSPKSSDEDTKFLLDWGGAGEKHKHKSKE